nr:SJCHGC08743 protein [Schistosoma japonicum]
MYSQPLHPASSLSSGISLVHLTSNDSHNRHTTAITTSINSVISSGSNYPVCDGHFASKLKLSTKKCRVNDNYDNHFQNTTYLPLLLTLPCNDNCNNHCHNYISSSFIRKSDPFSESTAYYSSSSSSSSSSSCSSSSSTTGFSPTNSSLLSGRSN